MAELYAAFSQWLEVMTVLPIRKILSNAFLAAAGMCFIFGAGVTVGDVILRAVAGRGVPSAIELTSLSIGLGALLSMPVCYAKQSHVTARLLSELSPSRFSRPFGIIGGLFSLVFAALLLWIVAGNAYSKLGSLETTADLGLSMPLALSVVAIALAAALVAALAGLFFALTSKGDPQ